MNATPKQSPTIRSLPCERATPTLPTRAGAASGGAPDKGHPGRRHPASGELNPNVSHCRGMMATALSYLNGTFGIFTPSPTPGVFARRENPIGPLGRGKGRASTRESMRGVKADCAGQDRAAGDQRPGAGLQHAAKCTPAAGGRRVSGARIGQARGDSRREAQFRGFRPVSERGP